MARPGGRVARYSDEGVSVMARARTIGLALAALVVIGLVVGAFAVVSAFLREPPPDPAGSLRRPIAGEVRPDHLADGTPVWVVGHQDGSVDVLSGFDTHTPFNLGKALWWCPTAEAFENPHHGSKYDAYGIKVGGPAPSGLPSYEVRVSGSRVFVGAARQAPAAGTPHAGPTEGDRDWCMGIEDGVVFHTFDRFRVWHSPTAAVASDPSGWVLLEGELAVRDGAVRLCAATGCGDSVVATNVEVPPDPSMEYGPLGEGRFIARVRDGALTEITRVLPLPPP